MAAPGGATVVRRSFYPLLECSSLPRIRFHDLRHTAATLLLGQGVHPKIVSEMLGHSQIAITLDLYSHVTPTMQRQPRLWAGGHERISDTEMVPGVGIEPISPFRDNGF